MLKKYTKRFEKIKRLILSSIPTAILHSNNISRSVDLTLSQLLLALKGQVELDVSRGFQQFIISKQHQYI